MTTATRAARRVKPQRFIRWVLRPGADGSGAVRITVGKEATDYLFRWLPPDCGKAVELTKLAADGRNEVYHLDLAADGGPSCDCKGHTRWGRCKHVDGLLALLNR
jgi:hypothetical protein